MKRRAGPSTKRRTAPEPGRQARAAAIAAARAADEKLAERTVVLDVRGITPVADFMVIATASTGPHLRAVAEAAEEAVARAGGHLHHREGDARSPWILLDAHDVLVHVFDPAARRRYDLERLWADAKRVPWKARATGRKAG